jgi:hypothetical protein
MHQRVTELDVFRTLRDRFRDPEVMRLQTPRDDVVRRRRCEPYQSITPTARQHRRGFHDSLRIIAEGLVEQRALADRAIQQIGHPAIGVPANRNVHLHRSCHRFGERARYGTMQCLAPNDQELVHAQNGAGRADRMLELVASHAARSARANAR